MEKTWPIRQESVAREENIQLPRIEPLNSPRWRHDMLLPDFGPCTLDFTSNGQYMAIGGLNGHLGLVDMKNMSLVKEFQVKEKVRDVVFLHNEFSFAATQKESPYIYNWEGTALRCLKDHGKVSRLRYLKRHSLLASLNESGELHYEDVTTGEMVGNYRTGFGVTKEMQVNPRNGIVALGHSFGRVSMWCPLSSQPLLQIQCHKGPISAMAFHPDGYQFATSTIGSEALLWDLRKFLEKPIDRLLFRHAKTINFSQQGHVAYGVGQMVGTCRDRLKITHILQGCDVRKVQFQPYENVLVAGHSKGCSILLVPDPVEPHYVERSEGDIVQLPPETIMFDPTEIAPVRNPELKRKKEKEAEIEAVLEAFGDLGLKNKTKEKNRLPRRTLGMKTTASAKMKPLLMKKVAKQV